MRTTSTRCTPRRVPVGPENPHGNAFRAVATQLRSEREAQQLIDPLRARFWRVANPDRRNAVGEPVAYKLVPGDERDAVRRAGVKRSGRGPAS